VNSGVSRFLRADPAVKSKRKADEMHLASNRNSLLG
jgi:hypothetical protein